MRNKLLTILSGMAVINLAAGLVLADSNSAPALSSANAPAVAWSAGALRINGADHTGSGNVLPGSKLEMLRASGQLYLADGTRMRLSAATRMTVESQTVSLESGVARVDAIPSPNRPLHILAGELQVMAGGGTITRPQAAQLIVTAASTPTEVRRSNGVLVAMVRPGQTLSFSVGAGAAAKVDTRLTGKVTGDAGHYFLTDEVTSLKTEIQGGKPASYDGSRVQVRGEFVNSGIEGRHTLLVKEYAMVQAQSGASAAEPVSDTPEPDKNRCKEGNAAKRKKCAAAIAGGAGAAGAAGGAAAAGAAGAAAVGVSTAVVAGVVVATVAAVATSVALVATGDSNSISQ